MNNQLKSLICSIAYSPLGDKLISCIEGPRLYAEYAFRSRKKAMLAEAKRQFAKRPSLGDFYDYKETLEKDGFSYNEYAYQYELYRMTGEERGEFISRANMAYFYWRYTPGTAKSVFRNKTNFLKTFEKYIHRKWMFVPDVSFESFIQMITSYDCIVKPYDGKLGRGIFMVKKDDNLMDNRKLYEYCVKNRMLLEEVIESCEELKVFHPQSLNTIRVVTISNKEKAEVFGSFLRTGRGNNVVDNAHAGGIFAQINIKEGHVESNGIDTNNVQYECHPDSGVRFMNYEIPKWDVIVKTCCEAAKLVDNPITGWGIAINCHGDVVFVEGNYGPDFDVMQSPLKRGVKKRITAKVKEYFDIEM